MRGISCVAEDLLPAQEGLCHGGVVVVVVVVWTITCLRQAVAQLVEAVHYKPEGPRDLSRPVQR
jgi:TM2 domain-containing membrane protein YozV